MTLPKRRQLRPRVGNEYAERNGDEHDISGGAAIDPSARTRDANAREPSVSKPRMDSFFEIR